MKFSLSSSALQSLLVSTGKVISNKSTLPILDYFLMELVDGHLKITASDLETTLIASFEVENIEQEGLVAAPAKLLLDSLKEFSDVPLNFDVNESTWEINISWASGSLSIPGADPANYPAMESVGSERKELELLPEVLSNGINKTIYATADDDLRPVMNGIFVNIEGELITFVATDAHKLVKYAVQQSNDIVASFILPKKPATLLRSLLAKEESAVGIIFDSKRVEFRLKSYTMVCRLIEGSYPNYNAVIPTANPNRLLVDRIGLINCIKRVAVCSNPTTNLIRMEIANNSISLTAQDLDFSVSANESISCSYDADAVVIGFKSTFLVELLTNTETPMVQVELADSTRAGVFKPVYDDQGGAESLMLLMPMMLNA